MKNLKIKICGMTDRENISRVLELEPDYLGFIFYPGSPRYVKDKISPEELNLVGGNVNKVGVFVNAHLSEIKQAQISCGLDVVQLHGDESPDFCLELDKTDLEVIKVFNVFPGFDFGSLRDYLAVTDFFLFDTKTDLRGGSGKKFAWDILDSYTFDKPFFLSGGISPSDSEGILSMDHPYLFGLDVNSGFEIRPGYKDIEALRVFINKLRLKNYE